MAEEKLRPDHYKYVDVCKSCKHCERTYHHCSACYENDEYTCHKHDDFIMTSDEAENCICDDFLQA
jgi:hypothetical protein